MAEESELVRTLRNHKGLNDIQMWRMQDEAAARIAALEAKLAEQETTLWARFKDILSALEATPPAPKVTATHRHKKRGTEYVLIGVGKMQAGNWFSRSEVGEYPTLASIDMREVAIYRSVDDGSLWVRPREEFEDGCFEALTAAQDKED